MHWIVLHGRFPFTFGNFASGPLSHGLCHRYIQKYIGTLDPNPTIYRLGMKWSSKDLNSSFMVTGLCSWTEISVLCFWGITNTSFPLTSILTCMMFRIWCPWKVQERIFVVTIHCLFSFVLFFYNCLFSLYAHFVTPTPCRGSERP